MQKRLSILFLALALAVSACQGNAPTAGAAPTSAVALAPTGVAQPPTATTAATQPAAQPVPAGCTAVSARSTPSPTEQSLFAPVTESDWVQGPFTATMTIIEYSDFQ